MLDGGSISDSLTTFQTIGPLDNSSLSERNVLVSLFEKIEAAPGDERDLAPDLNQSLRLIAVPKVKEKSWVKLCRKIKLKNSTFHAAESQTVMRKY